METTMESTMTITLPTKVKSILDTIIQEEEISPNELISTAIEEYLFFRQLRLLRERMIAKAQAQGIYTDQDVFDLTS
jgi:metal-responsive CopG/Arc/MetJ family transcriptional regulator